MRKISIFWWRGDEKEKIGTLVEVALLPIVFEWDKIFLDNDIELSPLRFKKAPHLIECPNEPFHGLPGLFADCVPDGWGRVLLKRGLSKRGISSEDISPLDAMAYIGNNGMGALAFEPEMEHSHHWADGKVSLTDLEQEIQPILDGTPSAVIETFLENGASPNGMRPKIILKEKDGKFYSANSPVEGDEWIIKFKASVDPIGIGKLEYIYSKMAQAAGLEMAKTRLFTSNKSSFFGTKRFDRTKDGRLHVHTLSGMLHVDPGNVSTSYEHFARVAQHLTKDMREIEKVIRIAAFNVLASNQDDHSKNVAFTMDSNGRWNVAPAYDLTFHTTRFSEHKMSLGGKGNPTEEDMIALGVNFGFSKLDARTIVEEVKEGVSKFETLSKEHDLPKWLQKNVGKVLETKLRKTSQVP